MSVSIRSLLTRRKSYRALRSWLLAALRTFWRSLDRKACVRRSQVRRHVDLPSGMPRARRQRGSVWGITTVRDEADIIGACLRHQFAQGIDAIIIADNGSVDGTRRIVQELADHYPIYLVSDHLVPFYQAEKMSNLARLARLAGADWVLPFDADEFWFADGESVGNYLRHAHDFDIVVATIHDMVPNSDQEQSVDSNSAFIINRQPGPFYKVAFRSHRWAFIGDGNHSVIRPGKLGTGLRLAHLPVRSLAQFTRKARQGADALIQAGGDANVGGHWLAWSALTDDELRDQWIKLRSTPAYSGHDRPSAERHKVLRWSSWQFPSDEQL